MYCFNITIKEDQQEIATAIGYMNGMGGCVEEAFGNDIVLNYYFENEDNAKSAASSFAETFSIDTPKIEFIEDKQDWNAKWRESMEPALIADGVWVSPTWLPPPVSDYKAWIKIEPKMAFGTGHHETTRLAAQMIIAQADGIAGKSILDIGTGSGVLCFVADYVGASNSVGVEIDEDCRENLAENLRDNPPRGNVEFIIGTLDSMGIDTQSESGKKFDAVIMNMLITESEPLLKQVTSISNKGAILIWSGILADEKNDAINAAQKFGWKLSGELIENEWWAGAFTI